jgi:putative ABC transport system permease protein
MFFRLLMESFRRQRRRKALAGLAILLGTTAVTAMLALATTIGDRIHKELAVYGANIVVYPSADLLDVKVGGVDVKPATGGAYLKESDLEKLKGIFWANNITGVSPELSVHLYVASGPGIKGFKEGPIPTVITGLWFSHKFGNIITGAPQLHPWWKLEGQWPEQMNPTAINDASYAVIGSNLAKRMNLKIGDMIFYHADRERFITPLDPKWGYADRFVITGIVTAGDDTDERILTPLADAQVIFPHANHLRLGALIGNVDGAVVRQNRPTTPTVQPIAFMPEGDLVSRVEVSAQTKPEDAFARKDPDSLPAKQREIWYCRPYANSIAYQIREAIPGAQAEQVRRVEQNEGNVLARISGLMWLVSAAALLAAGFAVSAAMATAVLERRGEIGLMRSLGASKGSIALLFYAETGLLAVLAGGLGYLFGSGLAAWLGARIFAGDGAIAMNTVLIPVLFPVVVALALVVAIAGSTPSIRAALKMDPSAILRADA